MSYSLRKVKNQAKIARLLHEATNSSYSRVGGAYVYMCKVTEHKQRKCDKI